MTDWQWWHSQDEERWQGPFPDREAAVAEGRDSYGDEGFYVCEACQEDHSVFQVDAVDLLERLAEQHYELADPDGDGLFPAVSAKQAIELGRELTDVLHRWVVRHGIKTGIYHFADSRHQEIIPPPPPGFV
jgi:hypothetical protein